MGRKWTAADVPDQRGRVVVITGANSGIGFEAAALLADKGAQVVVAVRDCVKGKQAVAAMRKTNPEANVALHELDLASLSSIRAAAEDLKAAYPRIHLLINNAGVMGTPKAATKDGFELQLGTNHLGHFAFTGLLLDHLLPVADSRIVTVSSLGHRARAAFDFDDMQSERSYDRFAAYGRSKLANLLFTYELQRRLAANGETTIAVAAHPGSARTGLGRNSPAWLRIAFTTLGPLIFQSPRMGALPTLRAATDPTVRGGQYYGPGGFAEQRGYPIRVESSAKSHDEELQQRLWRVSEELTGVTYPI
jgi:NAD(P)-dependent dehydrogenase (short-subunit alcohol dehydrogenase family)